MPRIYDPPLDKGIATYVERLNDEFGVETYESCEGHGDDTAYGGEGHCYPEPTIAFHGEQAEGFRALAAALTMGFPVAQLRRVWSIQNGEPTGPHWHMVFWRKCDEKRNSETGTHATSGGGSGND